MLESLAVVTKVMLEIALAVVVFRLACERSGFSNLSFIPFAIISSFLFAALAAYQFDFFGDREIFDAVLAATASVLIMIFSYLSYKGIVHKTEYLTAGKKISAVLLGIGLAIITLSKAIEAIDFISNIFIMNTIINSDLIIKVFGSLLGMAVSIMLIVILFRIKKWVTDKMLLRAVIILAFILIFRYMITVFQTLFATGILPLKPWVLAILSPLINTYYPMLFYIILALLFFIWYTLKAILSKNKPDVTNLDNPAAKRKYIARFIKEKNWILGLGTTLACVALVLSTNAVMANRKVNIEPPIPVTANNGVITIALSEIEDYNLHRFSYSTSNKVEVRFIVIRKGESIYGTGLDACDICGEAGYYQRGKEVICKNCDVVINIPTIGFPGGCNPIPIKAKVDGSGLVIDTSQLEEHQDVFSE